MTRRLNEEDPVWIPCENLSVVWTQAQRPFKPKRAREIADNFDPDLFDPLKVTKPNGEGIYHICDGQTRKAAVESLWGPKQKVPCYVSDEGDPQRASEIFLQTNTGRRPPTTIDNFKVSVTAQRNNEVAIDKIVRHHGFRVDGSSALDAIPAVAALLAIYTVCGPSVLNQTLATLLQIWGHDRNAVAGPMLRGFGVFLNEFGPHLNQQRLIDATKKKWTPGNLHRDAKAYHEVHGTSITESIVQLLTINYNKFQRGGTPLKRKESKTHKDSGKEQRPS